MTGVFNQRPSQSKYTFILDAETVLVYLRSQPENQCFSDKVLTLKLVNLNCKFKSELTNLNINCLVKSGTCYIFHPNKLSKTCCKH